MRLFTFCALALALCALVLVACQSESSYAPQADDESIEAEESVADLTGRAASPSAAPPDASDGSTVPVHSVQDTTQRRAPILLRTADLSFRVDDYPEAAEAVPGIVRSIPGAYLAGEQENRSSYRVSNTFTIRVPAAQFDSLLSALTPLAAEVESRSISVTDVTEEYVDVEARLEARRAVEAQYVTLLGRANSVEDVLQVQERLARVREEIESAQGRLRYLRDRAAMSTLTLTLYESSPTGISQGPGFFSRLADAFGEGWEAMLALVVALVTLWPAWVFFALVWFGWRAWRRRNPDAFRRSSRRSTRREAGPPTEPD